MCQIFFSQLYPNVNQWNCVAVVRGQLTPEILLIYTPTKLTLDSVSSSALYTQFNLGIAN